MKKFANVTEDDLYKDEDAQPMTRLGPPSQPRHTVTCLKIQLQDVRGKFDVVKAKKLGLKPGKCFAELVKGNCVTTETGVVVSPEDCVGPNVPGQVIVIVSYLLGFCSFF
jgi:ribonuclease Z